MKKITILFSLFVAVTAVSAQSTEAGKQHYYYQRYQSAETFFHDQLKQQPVDAEAWLWLIKSYIAQNELQKATDSLSFAPSSLYSEPYYMLAKASVHLVNNKADSARLLFDQAIDETRAKDEEILGLVAEAHVDAKKGDAKYALEVLTKALKRDKNNAWLLTVMGNNYRKMHNASEAFSAYQKAIDKNENYAEAYYQLGTIFQSQKNPGMYLDYFNKAIAADKNYAPAYYELYSHYLYVDPSKAINYFNQYAALSDKTLRHDYANADLLYLNKQYEQAILHGKKLLAVKDVQPRIYKLIAYSYAEMKDSMNAADYMKQYFVAGSDSDFIARDYETMAELYTWQTGGVDSAMLYYQKAVAATPDSSEQYKYYGKLATLAKTTENYELEAKWLGSYYTANPGASNVDLFNWGVAAYRARDYPQADSAFAIYTAKYPEQAYGYYWRAISNAAIDTAMQQGLAIPHYQKLIEVINEDSLTAGQKKWILDAYNYLAAYETNTQKDYEEAITYFGKILEIDPENADAKKYIAILEKNIGMKQEEDTN